MKKKSSVGLILVLALLLGTLAAACAPGAADNGPKPSVLLYDDDQFGADTEAVSVKFTTRVDYGNTIRVWYDNCESGSVKVKLYKYGWFGSKDMVLEFPVAGNDEAWEAYTSPRADMAQYYIDIQADDGSRVAGHLSVEQASGTEG